MRKIQIKTFLAGLLVALSLGAEGFAQSAPGRPQDSCESTMVKTQPGSLIDRDMVARGEERALTLRSKLFDLDMKEIDLLARLDDLDYRSSPDGIQRALAFVGSARPMDELRDALRTRLEGEKARVSTQLERLESTREMLETAIREADADLDRLRGR